VEKTLPKIHVIATGGTISYRAQDVKQERDFDQPRFDIAQLLAQMPQVRQTAEITAEQIFQIGSTSISDSHWLQLAHRVNALLEKPEVDGVVITHGTDTLEETAFFLNLVVKSDKPVVLTGAMRPATGICAEGELNLIHAVLTASCPQSWGKGVLVTMDEQIFAARDVCKCSTYKVGAFEGTEYGCIGKLVRNQVQYAYSPIRPHTTASEFDVSGLDRLPKVEIVYGYSDCSTTLLQAAAQAGAEGIVYAGTGSGILHPDVRALYERHHSEYPILVRSSRIYRGGVGYNNFLDDDLHGTVAAWDFNPQKARILLKLALTKTKQLEQIRSIFDRY